MTTNKELYEGMDRFYTRVETKLDAIAEKLDRHITTSHHQSMETVTQITQLQARQKILWGVLVAMTSGVAALIVKMIGFSNA